LSNLKAALLEHRYWRKGSIVSKSGVDEIKSDGENKKIASEIAVPFLDTETVVNRVPFSVPLCECR